jgi:histidine ammonia-lyase
MPESVLITGRDLGVNELVSIARGGAGVHIAEGARAQIVLAAQAVASAAARGVPIYGVTTGLGPRVVEAVDQSAAAEFSLRTVRGRAMAVGEPLPTEVVRAAMAIRLNGLCTGGAGAGLTLADALAGALNARVHPRIPRSGSVGAADLCLLAHVGLALIGEGDAEFGGEWLSAAVALERAGLEPVRLGAKDGLAICSSSAVTAGVAALALRDAEDLLAAAQAAAALSMEGFRANLSPLDPRVVAARPAPGQDWSATGLRSLLAGGVLEQPGAARRLQDPLSLRCVSQIHGSLRSALDLLVGALDPELNAAADNPLVLISDGEIVSTGNFHVPALALALDAVAVGVSQVASAASERQARLKTERLSGLPAGLAAERDGTQTTRSGMAPLSKTAQSLSLEIRHLAAPLAIHPTVGADGVEDDSTGSAQAALRVREQLERLRLLIALELLVAAQAVDLAGVAEHLGAGTAAAHRCVRELVAPLAEDRALGAEVERLAAGALASGVLLARVRAETA